MTSNMLQRGFFKNLMRAAFLLLLLSSAATAAERNVYFVNDALGSPVAAMDQQGDVLWRESYSPYGERRTKSPENAASPAFTGKPEDAETGLVYMGARMYDPVAGRFAGIDPQGFKEGNPQSFGRYLYANNNPYRYTDPNGESPLDALFLAYDAATFASAVWTGNPVAMWDSGADLAASFVGVLSPMPGTGQVIKSAMAAEKIKKTIVIGENMARVEPAAKKLGAEIYRGMPNYKKEKNAEALEHNRAFIREKKDAGYEIVDIGPDFTRRKERGYAQEAYEMERRETKNYDGYSKAFVRNGNSSTVNLDR